MSEGEKSSKRLARWVREALLPLALVEREGLEIVAASASFGSVLGTPPESLESTALGELFDDASASVLVERLGSSTPAEGSVVGLPLRLGKEDRGILLTAWRDDPGDATGDATEDATGDGDASFVVLALAGGGPDGESSDREATPMRRVDGALVRQALEERDRAARAEAESRAKSIFLASISHELRTPLNSIVGHTDLLLEGIPVELPEPAKRHVRRVRVAVRHLTDLIDQVVTASKAEIGEEITIEEVELGRVAREVCEMIQPRAKEKELDLDLDLQLPDEPPTIRSHHKYIRQILLNLLSNAVKFTPEGWIRIEVEGGDPAVVRIRDSGIGIEPHERERIFERFRQADASGVRTGEGMGIGLWVSRTLVRRLGGEIRLESEPGEGSTFEVRLPADVPEV